MRKKPPARPLGMIIKVKSQAKKAKVDPGNSEAPESEKTSSVVEAEKLPDLEKKCGVDSHQAHEVPASGLVSYSDESENDD